MQKAGETAECTPELIAAEDANCKGKEVGDTYTTTESATSGIPVSSISSMLKEA